MAAAVESRIEGVKQMLHLLCGDVLLPLSLIVEQVRIPPRLVSQTTVLLPLWQVSMLSTLCKRVSPEY